MSSKMLHFQIGNEPVYVCVEFLGIRRRRGMRGPTGCGPRYNLVVLLVVVVRVLLVILFLFFEVFSLFKNMKRLEK